MAGESLARPKTHTPGSRVSNLGQRFYSPDLGRWINRDPMGEEGGLNVFGFCMNDPANRLDDIGYSSFSVAVKSGALRGGTVTEAAAPSSSWGGIGNDSLFGYKFKVYYERPGNEKNQQEVLLAKLHVSMEYVLRDTDCKVEKEEFEWVEFFTFIDRGIQTRLDTHSIPPQEKDDICKGDVSVVISYGLAKKDRPPSQAWRSALSASEAFGIVKRNYDPSNGQAATGRFGSDPTSTGNWANPLIQGLAFGTSGGDASWFYGYSFISGKKKGCDCCRMDDKLDKVFSIEL